MRLGLLIITLLILTACSKKQGEEGKGKPDKNVTYPSPLTPEVAVDMDLSSYLNGKVMLLNESGEFQQLGEMTPKKYYAFYETVSHCQPCHAFSPTLNTFYDVFKQVFGDDFELIVVSYDISDDLTKEYALKKMPSLPHLQFETSEVLLKELPFLKNQYPNLIITDHRGKVLMSSFDKYQRFHGPEVPMNYLKYLLEKK